MDSDLRLSSHLCRSFQRANFLQQGSFHVSDSATVLRLIGDSTYDLGIIADFSFSLSLSFLSVW